MYRLETILFSNGERFSLLVNEKTGIPDFYSTLWVTVELRNQSAVNTIRNKLGIIQWLMSWEKGWGCSWGLYSCSGRRFGTHGRRRFDWSRCCLSGCRHNRHRYPCFGHCSCFRCGCLQSWNCGRSVRCGLCLRQKRWRRLWAGHRRLWCGSRLRRQRDRFGCRR